TGLFNLTRELGGSFGTAWMGTLLDRFSRGATQHLAERVNAYNPAAQDQLDTLTRLAGSGQTGSTLLWLKVQLQGLIQAFDNNFPLVGAVFAAGIVLVTLLKRPRRGAAVAGAH